MVLRVSYGQPETLVLNDRPFGNALAVSFFRRCARLRLCAYDFHSSIQKRRGKLRPIVSFNESHVLYRGREKFLNYSCHVLASRNLQWGCVKNHSFYCVLSGNLISLRSKRQFGIRKSSLIYSRLSSAQLWSYLIFSLHLFCGFALEVRPSSVLKKRSLNSTNDGRLLINCI